MTIQTLINDLQCSGVLLEPAGDKLRVAAPRGTLTPELRALIAEHKSEILTNRQRFADIKERVLAAMDSAERMQPGRFEWGAESAEAANAGAALDEQIYNYVVGDAPVNEVAAAFREYLRVISRKDSAATGDTLELFQL